MDEEGLYGRSGRNWRTRSVVAGYGHCQSGQTEGIPLNLRVRRTARRVNVCRSEGQFSLSIQVACSVCGRKLSAPDAAAGTQGKCPNCGELLKIPAAPRAPVAEVSDRTDETPEAEALRSGVPSYTGLRIAGSVLRILALLYYVGAIYGLISLLSASPRVSVDSTMTAVLWVVGVATVGALMHGLGDGCLALRDIARNSHR